MLAHEMDQFNVGLVHLRSGIFQSDKQGSGSLLWLVLKAQQSLQTETLDKTEVLITELACQKVAGDVRPFLVCWIPFVLGSCLPLCMINRIICTSASQPASPWITVLPSRVSALHAAPPPPSSEDRHG